MLPYYRQDFGNASSIHGWGQRARAAVEEARQKVADLIGASSRDIVFTSGGTESDNTALQGVAAAARSRGNHIITTVVEHPAVLRACDRLEENGFRITRLPVDPDGLVDVQRLEGAIDQETILISVMHANNEIGSIQPIREIASLARQRGILFHTDAVQSVGKIPVDVESLGVDLLSLSAHKIHGPKGMGALYVRQAVEMTPLLYGGSQERSRRAGTENVPGIVGLGVACKLAGQALEDFDMGVCQLRDHLEEGILESIPHTLLNGGRTHRMPHVTNISFRYVEAEALLISLDFQGIAVSTGSACSSGTLEPSPVILAIGRRGDAAQGALRFSLSRMTRDEDIDYTLSILGETVTRMRELSPLPQRG
jgi:cysteine desulfurase